MKNSILVGFLLLALSSCGEFHHALNKGDHKEQYTVATKMYEQKKYGKAIELFEKAIPSYRGKPQMERIQYMIADSYMQTKSYTLAAYYFEKFNKNYPKSSKREESMFFVAQNYYNNSPVYSLDQKDTQTAISKLQTFIDTYPESERVQLSNTMIKELRYKLETKSFEIAKQYYHTENYKSAISSFDNLLQEYLGTQYKEEAMYMKFLSSYELAKNSVLHKKYQRMEDAVKVHQKLKFTFPDSKYLELAKKYEERLKKQLIDNKSLNK